MMPTLDELHAADKEHAAAIAALTARVDGHDKMIARHEDHLAKMDETIAVLRETIGRVATKDDILDLRKDIGNTFNQQLTAAHNSVPAKIALIFSGGMFLISLITLVTALAKSHG